MVHFEKVTYHNYRECLKLKVAEQQTRFVATNAISLAKAYIYYDWARPLIAYNDDVMIGFVLYRNHDELRHYVIDEFMIDERYQGKGFGRAAMELLIEMFRKEKRYPTASICYNLDNKIAQELYSSMGFQQVGDKDEANEVVAELTL